ncbi:cation channel sperm-associated auxiliary subunit zeta [Vipera latastei]
MGQGISHRHMGHSREFPESVFKDKGYKQKFAKHERDSKVAVPLPLQELMEEEVLAILKATLLDYQKKLGAHHPLTGEMEQEVDKLHLLLQGRGII